MKPRVLVLADSPTVNTGFGIVCRNILKILSDKYDFDVVGINFDGGYYDRREYPYRIYPARSVVNVNPLYSDMLGRQLFLDKLGTGEYELVFAIQDTFVIETIATKIKETNKILPQNKKFSWICYFPIDAVPEEKWIDKGVVVADYPVAYTQYGYNQCLSVASNKKELADKLAIIYHGIDRKIFRPLDLGRNEKKAARKKLFGRNSRKFVFMNLNRNQPRKDMFRSLQAAKMLTDKRKGEVYFYFHCAVNDPAGVNLMSIAKQVGLEAGRDWAFPNPKVFTASHGFPPLIVNQLYNLVDAVFSTTLGEGFGLSVIEAMAAGTPIIFPDNTSLHEIIGEDRGLLAKSGSNPQEFISLRNDNNRVRPICNLENLVAKMGILLDNKEKREKMANNALCWTKDFDWNGKEIGDKWREVFREANVHTDEIRRK